MENIFLYYFCAVNLISVFVSVADKIKAINHKRRISEKTLWLLTLAGGSAGMYITMQMIRHKTLHKKFMIGIPLIIVVQIILILILTKYYCSHIIS